MSLLRVDNSSSIAPKNINQIMEKDTYLSFRRKMYLLKKIHYDEWAENRSSGCSRNGGCMNRKPAYSEFDFLGNKDGRSGIYAKKKHLVILHHCCRAAISSGVCAAFKVDTSDNFSDCLTKALPSSPFVALTHDFLVTACCDVLVSTFLAQQSHLAMIQV